MWLCKLLGAVGGEFQPVTREALLAVLSLYPTLNIPSPASDDNEEAEPVAMAVGGMAFNSKSVNLLPPGSAFLRGFP